MTTADNESAKLNIQLVPNLIRQFGFHGVVEMRLPIRKTVVLISLSLLLQCTLIATSPVTSFAKASALTPESILGADCVVDRHKVSLKDGVAYGASKRNTTDVSEDNLEYWSASVRPDLISFGDIDRDGAEDAVTVIQVYYPEREGMVISHLVAFLNKNGKLIQADDIEIGPFETVDITNLSVNGKGVPVAQMGIRSKQSKSPRALSCSFPMTKGKLAPKCSTEKPPALTLKSVELSAQPNDVPTPSIDSLEAMPRLVRRTAVAMPVKIAKELSAKDLRGATFKLLGSPRLKLNNPNASLDQVVLGDLNTDGVKDAACIIAYNSGGSGTFYSLVPVVNASGQLRQIGEVELGDRIIVKRIAIDSGVINLGLVVHGKDDSMVQPTKPVDWKFKITDGKLIKLR